LDYLKEAGIQGTGMVLDVADAASVEGVVKAVGEQFGAPTILVNNAGITRDNLLMRMKDEEWDAYQHQPDFGLPRQQGLPARHDEGAQGRIINIASVVGATGNAGQTNYAAAKAGIIGFSKSLAREVGSRGITVNVVAPGFIDTDMTRALRGTAQPAAHQIPLAAWAQPEDIAHAVAFLASRQAGLHHRRNPACERRHVHGLSDVL
jgi:3-oxoacyl-[acyl-carrier protein] reductase